jgi:hypothetical protein
MDCECKGWKESVPQIEDAQVLAWKQGREYTGEKFLFCPWCGKTLNNQEGQHARTSVANQATAG